MHEIFIKGLYKIKMLNKLNLFSSVKINNQFFEIPLIRGNGIQNLQRHEQWMDEILKKLFSLREGSFIDVGVNVGQTLLKVKSISDEIPYYGFEPNPTCVLYVNELIKKNRIEGVAIFPVAISEKTEIKELNFYYDSDTDSAASIVADFRPSQKVLKKEYIASYIIDDFKNIINFSSVAVIKIDVEGGELEVLNGLIACIQSVRPLIVIEVLPVYKKENKDRLERQLKIQDILKKNNYSILRIMKTNNGHFSHFEQLKEIGIHSDMQWCDYVFSPNEMVSQL